MALKLGDLVIHANDAKERRMVRVVVALLPHDKVRTVFKYREDLPEDWRDRVMHDWRFYLHDPRRYNIKRRKPS